MPRGPDRASYSVSANQERILAEDFAKTAFSKALRGAGIDETKVSSVGELRKPVYIVFPAEGGYDEDDLFKIVKIGRDYVTVENFRGPHYMSSTSWDMNVNFWRRPMKESNADAFDQARTKYQSRQL